METTTVQATVAAVMTAPRFEITWARNIIEKALHGAGIPLTISGGVFYGQCMQIMLNDLVKQGVEYAITVDFDSLFTSNDVRRLLSWIMQRDDIDAITGVQIRRGKPSLLGTIPGGEFVDSDTKKIAWSGDPIEAATAHFGLTVLDLKKLANVQKPWFISRPDANGDWANDKIDDDVHFWQQWMAAGNSVYLDPGVRIGHMEEMVAVYDEAMQPMHVYPSEWERMANAR
jgi:hypothetical protein